MELPESIKRTAEAGFAEARGSASRVLDSEIVKAQIRLIELAKDIKETAPIEVPVKPERMSQEWLYCDHCNKRTNLRTCQVQRPLLPNTFTPLRDLDSVQWKCAHCGVWQ